MKDTRHDRHTRITDEYRDMRTRLEGATGELKSLQEKRATTLQASRDAGQRWRQIFKDAGGIADKDVRKIQTKEHTLAAEVEQLDDLISELTRHVDELRHWTGELRKQHVTSLYLTRREMAATRLTAALEAVFEKPEGKDLLEAISQRADSLNQEVIEDHGFLAGIGFDAHESMKPNFMAVISADDRRKVAGEVEKRTRALIADTVIERMSALDAEAVRFGDDLDCPLPPLGCEH